MGYWDNKQVLVTGAGGFIGSHLVELLVEEGASVRALVHYNSRGHHGHLTFLTTTQRGNVEVVPGDVRDMTCVNRAVRGCDCVFHLAALIGIPYSYVAPRSYVATNIEGTLNVLEAVRDNNVPRMIHTSTSEVYGTACYTPIDEVHPLQGQSPYSASKIGADKLAESYHLSYQLPVATVRPFNTFGPRQSARAVIPTIISQLLSGRVELKLGALDPIRDLTYVGDTVRGFLAVAESDKAIGETINVGQGKGIAIGDLARLLVEMIRPGTEIVSRENRIRPAGSEVRKLLCNNAKVAQLTGWTPVITLRQGLTQTIDFVQEHLYLYSPDEYTI